MLGKDIFEALKKIGTFDVFGIDIYHNDCIPDTNQVLIDLTDIEKTSEVLIKINPDIIIHTAAFVSLDFCEQNPKKAYALHRDVTGYLASFNNAKSKFIYISTDSVFDGTKGDYKEDDIPNPLNEYSKSKLEGENIAIQNNKNSIIIRTNLFGFHRKVSNSLAEWALKNIKKNEVVTGYADVYFNPVYTVQLAEIITDIIDKPGIMGILNVGSNYNLSKYDFIRHLSNLFELSGHIEKSKLENIDNKIQRSLNTTLNTDRLKSVYGKVPDFFNGLKQFKEDYIKTNHY